LPGELRIKKDAKFPVHRSRRRRIGVVIETSLKAGCDRSRLARSHAIENGDVVWGVISSVASEGLVLPLHKSVGFGDVKFFFICTARVVGVTTIAVADYKGLQIARELAAQSLFVGSPNLIDNVPEILPDERVAVGVNFVRGIADLDA